MSEELPVPQTQYAESDGLSIAFQVFGSGTTDLVRVPGIVLAAYGVLLASILLEGS
ncbi:MAG: hypothetical protein ABI460_13575 [Caldimonas sp.]